MSGSWAVNAAVRRLATAMSATHGPTASDAQGDEAPHEVPEQQPERAAHHGPHQVDEQRLGRPHRQVGLVEQALQDLEHASTRRHLGHGGHGTLEQRGLDELRFPSGRGGGARPCSRRVPTEYGARASCSRRGPLAQDDADHAPRQEAGGGQDEEGDEELHRRATRMRANSSTCEQLGVERAPRRPRACRRTGDGSPST